MVLSKKQRQAIEWRRSRVYSLHTRNYSIAEIARELAVSERTISNDIAHWNTFVEQQDNEHIKRVNITVEKTVKQFQDLVKEAWKDKDSPEKDIKDKQIAITTIKECNIAILEILAAKTSISKLTQLSDIVQQKLNSSKQPRTTEDNNKEEHKANEV